MHRLSACALLVSLWLVGGCGDTLTISGSVTYEGNPIEEGQISFTSPAVTAGAPIKAGKYELSGKLKPGKYTVNVSGQMKASTPNAPLKSGDAMKPDDSTIPDSAVGNGQTIEITGPRNDLNFALKKPAK
jgi:hypothetical protein